MVPWMTKFERRKAASIAWTIAALAGGSPTPSSAQAGDPGAQAPTLTAMRAHLFRNKTAILSDDIFDGSPALWNSFAGDNAANAVLVVIEISGPPNIVPKNAPGQKARPGVRMTARETGRRPNRLLDQTQAIPAFNKDGKVYLGFWITPGGCAPVQLKAVLAGALSAKPIEKSLEFACGE